ncbi:hypothetical protein HY637_04795 [Candidatus Woesearchaeota archaeon]|nr:hypothetical protein [Candidatus Woesearchaeota archaeon]
MTIDLAVIADKEGDNLKAIIDNVIFNPGVFNLRLVISPFSDLDEEFFDLLLRYRFSALPAQEGQDLALHAEPITYPDLRGVVKNRAIAHQDHVFTIARKRTDIPEIQNLWEEIQTIHFLHAPYKARMNDHERAEYCEDLKEAIRPFDVDIILLSNYKVILAPGIIREFEGRIVNLHPSVLPYNRGWRTERMALEANNPDASGYTIHVATTDLDEGPVLFQQNIPMEGHNEESLRRATMRAQSRYITGILKLYALSLVPNSGVETKIVEAEGALEAEGRRLKMEFLDSKGFQKYRRMLFKHNGEFTTLEKILGVPSVAPSEPIEMDREYVFELIGESRVTLGIYLEILRQYCEAAGKNPESDRMQELVKVPDFQRYGNQPARLRTVKIRDATGILGKILDGIGIPYRTIDYPVNVLARRKEGMLPVQYKRFAL